MVSRSLKLAASLAVVAAGITACSEAAPNPVGVQTVRLALVADARHGGAPFSTHMTQEVTSTPPHQGDVDGTGTVADVTAQGESWWVTFNFPALLAPYFVRKGSIAVDGVSLTVAGLSDRQFDVQIIPFTWEHTNFHTYRKGDHVNLECDILGKYVVRTAELSGWTPAGDVPRTR